MPIDPNAYTRAFQGQQTAKPPADPVQQLMQMFQMQQAQKASERADAQFKAQQQMQPLQMQLLQAQADAAKSLPAQRAAAAQKAEQEAAIKQQQFAAQQALARQLAMPSEEEALARALELDRQNKLRRAAGEPEIPVNIQARNPQTVQGLAALAQPSSIPNIMKGLTPNADSFGVVGPGAAPFNKRTGQVMGQPLPFAPKPEPSVYMAPMPTMGPNGPQLIQPSNRSDVPARVLSPDLGTPVPSSAQAERDRKAAQEKQDTDNAASMAEQLAIRLSEMAKNNPRSTTGLGSSVVRGWEAVADLVAPGSGGSQATEALQTKEQLLNVLQVIRKTGRRSNQDQQRLDRAIGALKTGTSKGLQQGVQDTLDYIDVASGKPARSLSGQGKPSAESDRALIEKYLPK